MYSVWALGLVGGGFFVWLCILTYLYIKETKQLSQLIPEEKGDIRKTLAVVIDKIDGFAKKEEFFEKVLKEQSLEGLNHVQRVQISRYNPYNDTGGSQSFSICLLDGKDNGTLITSLHSRAGTRIYVKVITQGKSDMELSKEEKELVKKTIG